MHRLLGMDRYAGGGICHADAHITGYGMGSLLEQSGTGLGFGMSDRVGDRLRLGSPESLTRAGT